MPNRTPRVTWPPCTDRKSTRLNSSHAPVSPPPPLVVSAFVLGAGGARPPRIAHIAQPAGLGDAEPHAAGDLAAMHVQAGNDTFSDHHGGVNRFAARESISPSDSQPALAATTPPG